MPFKKMNQQPAGNLYAILCYTAPPLTAVRLLQEREELPADVVSWLRRWDAIRAGEPVPVLDTMGGQTDGIQED